MEIVSEWLVDTSTWNNASIDAILQPDTGTTSTNTTLGETGTPLPIETIALIGGIGAVIAVVVVVALFKRKA